MIAADGVWLVDQGACRSFSTGIEPVIIAVWEVRAENDMSGRLRVNVIIWLSMLGMFAAAILLVIGHTSEGYLALLDPLQETDVSSISTLAPGTKVLIHGQVTRLDPDADDSYAIARSWKDKPGAGGERRIFDQTVDAHDFVLSDSTGGVLVRVRHVDEELLGKGVLTGFNRGVRSIRAVVPYGRERSVIGTVAVENGNGLVVGTAHTPVIVTHRPVALALIQRNRHAAYRMLGGIVLFLLVVTGLLLLARPPSGARRFLRAISVLPGFVVALLLIWGAGQFLVQNMRAGKALFSPRGIIPLIILLLGIELCVVFVLKFVAPCGGESRTTKQALHTHRMLAGYGVALLAVLFAGIVMQQQFQILQSPFRPFARRIRSVSLDESLIGKPVLITGRGESLVTEMDRCLVRGLRRREEFQGVNAIQTIGAGLYLGEFQVDDGEGLVHVIPDSVDRDPLFESMERVFPGISAGRSPVIEDGTTLTVIGWVHRDPASGNLFLASSSTNDPIQIYLDRGRDSERTRFIWHWMVFSGAFVIGVIGISFMAVLLIIRNPFTDSAGSPAGSNQTWFVLTPVGAGMIAASSAILYLCLRVWQSEPVLFQWIALAAILLFLTGMIVVTASLRQRRDEPVPFRSLFRLERYGPIILGLILVAYAMLLLPQMIHQWQGKTFLLAKKVSAADCPGLRAGSLVSLTGIARPLPGSQATELARRIWQDTATPNRDNRRIIDQQFELNSFVLHDHSGSVQVLVREGDVRNLYFSMRALSQPSLVSFEGGIRTLQNVLRFEEEVAVVGGLKFLPDGGEPVITTLDPRRRLMITSAKDLGGRFLKAVQQTIVSVGAILSLAMSGIFLMLFGFMRIRHRHPLNSEYVGTILAGLVVTALGCAAIGSFYLACRIGTMHFEMLPMLVIVPCLFGILITIAGLRALLDICPSSDRDPEPPPDVLPVCHLQSFREHYAAGSGWYLLLLLLFAAAFVFFATVPPAEDSASPHFPVFFTGMAALASGILFLRRFLGRRTARCIENVCFSYDSEQLVPGTTGKFRMQLQARKKIALQGIHVRIKLVSTRFPHGALQRELLAEEYTIVEQQGIAEPGSVYRVDASIPLPANQQLPPKLRPVWLVNYTLRVTHSPDLDSDWYPLRNIHLP